MMFPEQCEWYVACADKGKLDSSRGGRESIKLSDETTSAGCSWEAVSAASLRRWSDQPSEAMSKHSDKETNLSKSIS
jgi:hypothetical protein